LSSRNSATPSVKIFAVGRSFPKGRALRKHRYSENHGIYFITACCYRRTPSFKDASYARIVEEQFERLAAEGLCVSLAHVVMPDHVHWLVPLHENVRLALLVRYLKGRTARQINLLSGKRRRIWQAGYHDHAVRVSEDLRKAAEYLIHNPVRAGLVQDPDDYPHWDSVWHDRRRDRG
jgi:REP element-mobilizing transposase RayT